jgi:hypothetical protein
VLSCKQVVDRADQWLAGELPWRPRFGVLAHLMTCSLCRRYLRQLRLVLAALPHLRPRATEEQVEAVMARVRTMPQDPRADPPPQS